jgi:hypothetical protein
VTDPNNHLVMPRRCGQSGFAVVRCTGWVAAEAVQALRPATASAVATEAAIGRPDGERNVVTLVRPSKETWRFRGVHRVCDYSS